MLRISRSTFHQSQAGTLGIVFLPHEGHAPQPGCGSPLVPTIPRHGPHFDSGGSEELADLGGVLNDVQRDAADDHSVQHAGIDGYRAVAGPPPPR